jgi:competence protein ComEC
MDGYQPFPSRIMRPSLRFLRDRPAVASAALLAIGVLLHTMLPCRPVLWILISLGSAVLARICSRWGILSSLVLAVSAIGLGAAAAQLDRSFYPANEISAYLTAQPRVAQLEILVAQPPREIISAADRPLPTRIELRARVLRVKQTDGWAGASGWIAVSLPNLATPPHLGQTMRVIGFVSHPTAPDNPGATDWAAIDRDQHLLAEMRVNHPDCVEILSDPGIGALTTLRGNAADLLAAGFSPADAQVQSLLGELTLGISDARLTELRAQCASLGLSYQFSISGLHLAIIWTVAVALCRLLRLDPLHRRLIALCLVLIYFFVATPSEAGMRAVLVLMIAECALRWDRSVNRAQWLAVGVAALLLWHPSDLYTDGFQISVAAATGLLLFGRPVMQWLRGESDVHSVITSRDRLRHWLMWQAAALFAGALIAWTVTLPLVAFWFGQAAPAGVAASLLLLPLTIITLLAGLAKIFLTLCMPGAAAWLATIATWPAALLLHNIAAMSARIGAGDAPPPSMKLIALYYVLLLTPLAPRFPWLPKAAPRTIWPRRSWRPIFPAAAVALLFAALHLPSAPPIAAQAAQELRVTLLSVGSGQCAIIDPPGAAGDWIIDAGSSVSSKIASDVIQPFLESSGQRSIAGLILTRGDVDHSGAAVDLLHLASPSQVMFSPEFQRLASADFTAQRVLDAMSDLDRSPRLLSRGDNLALSPSADLRVLWPTADFRGNLAQCGLILRLTFGGRSILFPSDAGQQNASLLLQHRDELKSDVLLVAPHQGSDETGIASLISSAAPADIVVSSDAKLTRKQLNFDTLTGSTPLYRTGECGAITIHIRSDGALWITTFRSTPTPGIAEVALR